MNKPIINITKNAFTKMETIMKKSWNKNGFLFGVTSGGCNGFNFNLKLIESKELDKIKKLKPNILSQGDVNVFVEPLSEIYLIGTTIDYTEENFSEGIFESKFIYNINKELATSCGCGVSFNPKKL